MALRDTLEAVLREYDSAKLTRFIGNPLAAFIRTEAVLELERAAGPVAVGLLFAGSAGAENWAEVPWLAAFDPVVTDSASRGYYVVYLFDVSESIVHLSLNQGTTAVREEFGVTARQVLSERGLHPRTLARLCTASFRDAYRAWLDRAPVWRLRCGPCAWSHL
jgi:5-methylcytosine-specific restriction protein A